MFKKPQTSYFLCHNDKFVSRICNYLYILSPKRIHYWSPIRITRNNEMAVCVALRAISAQIDLIAITTPVAAILVLETTNSLMKLVSFPLSQYVSNTTLTNY